MRGLIQATGRNEMMRHRLKERLAGFQRNEDGSMSIELLLVTPILVWVLLSTFVYFDVFRVEATANKAAITISEMFSREEVAITDTYVDAALSVFETLTYEEENPDLRVTVYYNDPSLGFQVIWSEFRGGYTSAVDNSVLAGFNTAGQLPRLEGSDHAILLETRVQYDAPFSLGFGQFSGLDLENVEFNSFIVIRPRPGKLCFDPAPPSAEADLLCGPALTGV